MTSPLAIYLHDHLAASHFAIELLEGLADRHQGGPLGNFCVEILAEIREDQQALESMIAKVGEAGYDSKDLAAWVAEKASRMKLRQPNDGGLGTFEALETLALGVQGKLALWQVLPVVAQADYRLRDWDFTRLGGRARDQFSRLNDWRLKLAQETFAGKK
jgi:hypothetical protein